MRPRRVDSRLRALCVEEGLSLADLAHEAGLSIDAVRRIDAGRREPLITSALLLAEVLGVEVEDIFSMR